MKDSILFVFNAVFMGMVWIIARPRRWNPRR
ncbi:hypothetical protein LINPERHAP1_LOCUS30174 [Linum perenne]